MTARRPSRQRPVESAGVLGRVKAKPASSHAHGGLDSPCAFPLSRSCRRRDVMGRLVLEEP